MITSELPGEAAAKNRPSRLKAKLLSRWVLAFRATGASPFARSHTLTLSETAIARRLLSGLKARQVMSLLSCLRLSTSLALAVSQTFTSALLFNGGMEGPRTPARRLTSGLERHHLSSLALIA